VYSQPEPHRVAAPAPGNRAYIFINDMCKLEPFIVFYNRVQYFTSFWTKLNFQYLFLFLSVVRTLVCYNTYNDSMVGTGAGTGIASKAGAA
jgi:hypothetical protein